KAIENCEARMKAFIKNTYALDTKQKPTIVIALEYPKGKTFHQGSCSLFKNILRGESEKLNLMVPLSKKAEDLIMNTCNVALPARQNLDPCFCEVKGSLSSKPGICRVNKCIEPGKLRCHCD